MSFITPPGHDGLGSDILAWGLTINFQKDRDLQTFGFLHLNVGHGDEKLVCDMSFFAARIPEQYLKISPEINQAVETVSPQDCSY